MPRTHLVKDNQHMRPRDVDYRRQLYCNAEEYRRLCLSLHIAEQTRIAASVRTLTSAQLEPVARVYVSLRPAVCARHSRSGGSFLLYNSLVAEQHEYLIAATYPRGNARTKTLGCLALQATVFSSKLATGSLKFSQLWGPKSTYIIIEKLSANPTYGRWAGRCPVACQTPLLRAQTRSNSVYIVMRQGRRVWGTRRSNLRRELR